MTSVSDRESSRQRGAPVELYLFKGIDPSLESMMRSAVIGPGATEFGYATTLYDEQAVAPINHSPAADYAYFTRALDNLITIAPGLKGVTLQYAWHGNDLRAHRCEVRPKVTRATFTSNPYTWRCGGIQRAAAQAVSQVDGIAVFEGAPSDRTIVEAIQAVKARGLRVTLSPILKMDIPAANTLVNPYVNGGSGQASYPDPKLITCSYAPGVTGTVDGGATAGTQVATFFGTAVPGNFAWNSSNSSITYSGPDEWTYRRFVLHLAALAAQAGGVDDFLIGSRLSGLTKVRSAVGVYPAVTALVSIAADVRSMLGSGPRISYGADWDEYHSHRPSEGEVFFNLDPLWASPNVNFVGIANYMPISDWRASGEHLDRAAGYASAYDRAYLSSNVEGGEHYDWTYLTPADRAAQVRTPITDTLGKAWVFRLKDLRAWWSNRHFDRQVGAESGISTGWVAGSKPIVFTEAGCPAVDFGANLPGAHREVHSTAAELPYGSQGLRDDAIQRVCIETQLQYWRPESGHNPAAVLYSGLMVEVDAIAVRGWDYRSYPTFPDDRSDRWGDTGEWRTGHWLTGRIYAGRAFDSGVIGPFGYTDGEREVVRDGVTYQPWPIQRSEIKMQGETAKDELTVRMAAGSALDNLFRIYPPSQPVNLFVFGGHADDRRNAIIWPCRWSGVVRGVAFPEREISLTCKSVASALKLNGLRRHFQLRCPHILYGEDCRADRKAATVQRVVTAISGDRVTLNNTLVSSTFSEKKYRGGLVEWTRPNGVRELRSIGTTIDPVTISLRGALTELAVGQTISISLGCGRFMTDCTDLHDNILNFGGMPWMPIENPLGSKNLYY